MPWFIRGNPMGGQSPGNLILVAGAPSVSSGLPRTLFSLRVSVVSIRLPVPKIRHLSVFGQLPISSLNRFNHLRVGTHMHCR
jgi:hypothetical protein